MKIRELSRAFGITPETLRFLEYEGLLDPKRNTANAYREYTIADFGTIIEYMKLKNMGLTIREIVALIKENSFDNACACIGEKYELLQKNLEREQLLCQYMKEFQKKMKLLSYNTGLYNVCTGDSLAYISVGQASTGSEKYCGEALALEWRKNVPFVSLGYLLQIENLQLERWPVECILTTEVKYVKMLGMPTDPSVKLLPTQMYIHTYAAFRDFDCSHAVYNRIYDFAKEKGYQTYGPIITILLLRLENGIKYVEIRLPIIV